VQPRSVRRVRLIKYGLDYEKVEPEFNRVFRDYALNFLALGTFSPLRIRSAPTFLPLLGQPVLRLHELPPTT